MRLFLALELPGSLQSLLSQVRHLLDPAGRQARWVRPESIHMTLRFLGETTSERVEALSRSLELIRRPPVDVQVAGIGFFPGPRSPRVLWAGADGDGLQGLVREIDQAVDHAGFPKASRPFHPHLTLARAPRKGTIGRALVGQSAELRDKEFGSFTADRFVLFRSDTRADGAVYGKHAEFVFGSLEN